MHKVKQHTHTSSQEKVFSKRISTDWFPWKGLGIAISLDLLFVVVFSYQTPSGVLWYTFLWLVITMFGITAKEYFPAEILFLTTTLLNMTNPVFSVWISLSLTVGVFGVRNLLRTVNSVVSLCAIETSSTFTMVIIFLKTKDSWVIGRIWTTKSGASFCSVYFHKSPFLAFWKVYGARVQHFFWLLKL